VLATPGLWPIILGLMFTFGFLFVVASVRNEHARWMRIIGAALFSAPLAAISDLAAAVWWVRHTGQSRMLISRGELAAIFVVSIVVWFLIVNAIASFAHDFAHRKNTDVAVAGAKH